MCSRFLKKEAQPASETLSTLKIRIWTKSEKKNIMSVHYKERKMFLKYILCYI